MTQESRIDLRLYAIIDPTSSRLTLKEEKEKAFALADMAQAAIAGGATLVQYRDKTADLETFVKRAHVIQQAIEKTAVPFIINDRLSTFPRTNAQGLHIGPEDIPPLEARKALPANAILGLTLKTREQIKTLADPLLVKALSYVSLGGIFYSRSKIHTQPLLGLVGLEQAVKEIRSYAAHLPICAISGITLDNASICMDRGIDGICVISGLFDAPDIEDTARRFRCIIDQTKGRRGSLPHTC